MDRKELQKLIEQSMDKLHALKRIDYGGLSESINELESVFNELKESGEELLSEENVLQIGIVGQVKAGKSSFLNSLFFDGEDVLPKASTPMTAGLTVLEYSEDNTFEVEYFNEKDWEVFERQSSDYKKREEEVREQLAGEQESVIKKEIENRTTDKVRSAYEMVSACSSGARRKIGGKNDIKPFTNLADLQHVLEQYVGANGEYTSVVKSLYIKMNDKRLQGLRIVDTPGVNDPVVSRENRTRTFLQACHGVFLLSAATDFLGSGDVSFLNTRIGGSGIGAVVLLASKFDSVLQDIGADHAMKMKEPADLADVKDEQIEKFKRRLREQSNTIDEKLRGRIKLDTTSGIGYSIAHKSSDNWGAVEKQVVEQMKRFYPDYFSTEKDIQSNFEELSNITEIRKKYLEKIFIKKKETIIAEKIDAFFCQNRKEIAAVIERSLNTFKNRQAQLEQATIAEIQHQKAIQAKLFDGLKERFFMIFSKFNSELQTIGIKEIKNKISFQDITEIPVEIFEGSVTCKGLFWRTTTIKTSYKRVNEHALITQIRKSVESYIASWNEGWKRLFEENRKKLGDTLNEVISEFEAQIRSTSFEDSYYRDLIDRALDKLRENKELFIGDLRTKLLRMGEDVVFESQFCPNVEDLQEKNVENCLNNQLNEHNRDLVKKLRIVSDAAKTDVVTEVQKNLNEAIAIINDMKTSFADKLKAEGDEYLTKLEEDMMDKTEVLKKIECIVNCIEGLSSLYK